MFFRLLMESFRRQRRRKLLAGIAILLGTTAVTAMLALATTIGDRIHKELAVYGANIIVYPKADQLEVKVGGVDIKPASSGTYLKETDLEKLKTIFWANNITGSQPRIADHHHSLRKGRLPNPRSQQSASGSNILSPNAMQTGATQSPSMVEDHGKWPSQNASGCHRSRFGKINLQPETASVETSDLPKKSC